MKVYCASKAHKHREWWRALRGCGLPIISTWPDWPGNDNPDIEPSAEMWAAHWKACIEQASVDCDVLLFVDFEGETQCGALIELGAALAGGKQVYIVSPNWWSIGHHPNCRIFPDLERACQAIMAGAQGERDRHEGEVYPALVKR